MAKKVQPSKKVAKPTATFSGGPGGIAMADEKAERTRIEFPPNAAEAAVPAPPYEVTPFGGFTKRERGCIDLKVPDSGLDWLDALIAASRELDIEQSIEQFKRMVPVQLEMAARVQANAKASCGSIAVPLSVMPKGHA